MKLEKMIYAVIEEHRKLQGVEDTFWHQSNVHKNFTRLQTGEWEETAMHTLMSRDDVKNDAYIWIIGFLYGLEASNSIDSSTLTSFLNRLSVARDVANDAFGHHAFHQILEESEVGSEDR